MEKGSMRKLVQDLGPMSIPPMGQKNSAQKETVKMLLPLSDSVWIMFFRGMVFGFFGGLVLILLFFWISGGKYSALAAGQPIGFVYSGQLPPVSSADSVVPLVRAGECIPRPFLF
jgi:hypothetical protein